MKMKIVWAVVWLVLCLLTGAIFNKIGVSWQQLAVVEVLFSLCLIPAYFAFVK
jgi:hypothetical protein